MKKTYANVAVAILGLLAVAATPALAAGAEDATTSSVTFTKDVLPIFQRSCQNCHRPDAGAPMSLLTYEETRPWARSIQRKVVDRSMPPWHLDPTVGVTDYIGDPSLSDAEIETIVAWVGAGAPRGNPADAPPPVEFSPLDAWTFGEPDLVIKNAPLTLPAVCEDQYPNPVVETGLTEDRWIKWIQFMPGDRRVVHHSMQYAVQEDPGLIDEELTRVALGSGQGAMLVEYAVGNQGDYYPDGTGRLLKAGSKVRFSGHYHCIGEEVTDVSSIGVKFYPKGEEPNRRVISFMLTTGVPDSERLNELSIPPHTVARHERYFRLEKPAEIITFQPHMHYLGKAMRLEVIHLDGRIETLTHVPNYDFNFQISYNYANPPLVPAGAYLHITSWHDNTDANRYNPDPSSWIGWGGRTVDEMGNGWVELAYMSEDEYERKLAEQKAEAAGATGGR
ncbi:MAG: cytochrome c [Thermoanaerobaculia bacterium]|nr:cytochrome c [Thermoanaerobaculia bacterium]